jgi:hypothetical protein
MESDPRYKITVQELTRDEAEAAMQELAILFPNVQVAFEEIERDLTYSIEDIREYVQKAITILQLRDSDKVKKTVTKTLRFLETLYPGFEKTGQIPRSVLAKLVKAENKKDLESAAQEIMDEYPELSIRTQSVGMRTLAFLRMLLKDIV